MNTTNTQDTIKLAEAERLLDLFIDADPERAERFIESQLARASLKRRLAALQPAAAQPQASEPSAPMSDANRLVAYNAAATLRSIGYEWDDTEKKWIATPARVAEPLTERQLMQCIAEAGCVGTIKMSFESGPYYIDRPTLNATKLCHAIERAHGITTTPAAKEQNS